MKARCSKLMRSGQTCGRPVKHPSRCVGATAYRRQCDQNRVSGANARSRDRRMWLGMLKLAYGCADCGYRTSAVALDFDHRPGTVKVEGVSVIAKRADTTSLFAELAKCEVVCKNCHAIRTISRGQHIVGGV